MRRLGRGMTAPALVLGLAAAYGVVELHQPTVVVGESMAPALPHGQILLVDRTYYRKEVPRPGEVVVFRHQGEACIKRVYRGPGETICFLESSVNGDDAPFLLSARQAEKVEQRFMHGSRRNLRIVRLRVAEDHVFVVGDNLGHSQDSRHYGAVPIRDLIGRVRVAPDLARVQAMEMSVPDKPQRLTALATATTETREPPVSH